MEGSHRILQGKDSSHTQSHEFNELQSTGNVEKRLSVSPVSSKSAGTPTRLNKKGSLSPVSSRHSISPMSGKVGLSPVSSNASLSPVSDDQNKSFPLDSGFRNSKTIHKRQNTNWDSHHGYSEKSPFKHRRIGNFDRDEHRYQDHHSDFNETRNVSRHEFGYTHYDYTSQNRQARSPNVGYRDTVYRQNRYDRSTDTERQYRRSFTPSNRHYNQRHSRSNSPSHKFSDHSSLYQRQRDRRSRSSSLSRKRSRSPKYYHSRSSVHSGRRSRSPSPRHTRSPPDHRHGRSSIYRHSVSPSHHHSRSPSYRRYRSRSPKYKPDSHRKSYDSPERHASPASKSKIMTPQKQPDDNLRKLTESASESISKTLLFADSAKPEELLSVLLLQNELIRKQQQIIEEKEETEPKRSETIKSMSPKRQVRRSRSVSPYKRDRKRSHSRSSSNSPSSRDSRERYRSISPYHSRGRRYSHDRSNSPYSRRSPSPYSYSDRKRRSISPYRKTDNFYSERSKKSVPSALPVGATSGYPSSGPSATMPPFSTAPPEFPGQSLIHQPGTAPPFMPPYGGQAASFGPPPTNQPPQISSFQFGGPTLLPAGATRPPQVMASSFPPVNSAYGPVTRSYGFGSFVTPVQRPQFPVFPTQSPTSSFFPPHSIAATTPTWSVNLNQQYQTTFTNQNECSVPKMSEQGSAIKPLQVNTISGGSKRNKANKKDGNTRSHPHLLNVVNMSQGNPANVSQRNRNPGQVNEDRMPEGYLHNEQVKGSGTARDSKIFKTFIGSKALLKWYITKPTYPANVQVRNGRGEVLFDAYGTEAKIRGTYKDRIAFTGDVSDGRIEFMLDNCSYADEGLYVALYGETQFKGPNLVLWLEVKNKDAAVLLWQTEPVPDFEPVKVYRKNGLVLFTAVKQKFTPTDEYKGRVNFTGDTTKGLIIFSLKDCTYGDEGIYVSSVDDKESDGRQLVVKISSKQRSKHVVESVEEQRLHLNRHRERHKIKLRNIKIGMLMAGIKLSPPNQPIQEALESVVKSVGGLQTHLSFKETGKEPLKFVGTLDLLSEGPKINLATETGKSKKITTHLLYKSAFTSLKMKSLSEFLSQKTDEEKSVTETGKELFIKLKRSRKDVLKRILINVIKDRKLPDEVFAQSLKTLYDRCHIDLVSVINAIRDHEGYKEEEGLRPDVDKLLMHPDIESNAEDLKKLNIKIPDHRNLENFVLLDSGDQKQRCNVWVQGNLVAESYSIGGKYGMQLAAARALAYLYENRPVIQKVAAKVVWDGNRLTYTKVRSIVEKKVKSGVGDDAIAKACEEILFRYKNQDTLETLEFHPGM
ncbi:hypothetical protein KUTeg_012382 [Tegillarca granosa]|uniref:Uncharacterized protein n=1 Tax=Tegillarca granosa TaxID=220873 RepID=A0ABQ9F2N6_TEGGR|nr:hypothetical protein KUTeg_012382 [Tegillarca granosa]